MSQRPSRAGEKDFVARRFARGLAPLPAHTPVADAYEREERELRPHAGEPWYTSQKQHITGWLNELDGPGAYDRKSRGLGARHFWNHFQCAPGLLWLAEALGENVETVQRAAQAAGHRGRVATQCAAIRKIIPWGRIAELAIAQGVGT